MSASRNTVSQSAKSNQGWQTPQGRKTNNNWNNNSNRSDTANWRAPKKVNTGNGIVQPQEPIVAAEPQALPTEIPANSPLRAFVDLTEAPCGEPEFAQKLEELPCDLKLKDKWVFWLESVNLPALPEKPQRDDFLKLLTIARTVSNLAKVKEYSLQACEHPDNAKIFLFKQGIKPVWEDRSNYNGGRLFVTCANRETATATFVTLALKMLAGSLLADSELTGLTVSFTGAHRFTVQVWNRNSAEKNKIRDARKAMKKLFKKNVSYQVHRTSLKIYKYGYEQVMPEIEKAQAAKEAKRAELAPPVVGKVKPVDELATMEVDGVVVVGEDADNKESILDQASKAILAAALASAWESRSPSVASN